MLISYLRSSSYNTYDMCPAQYLYRYVLGLEDKANFKACKGNVVHKVLEGLAMVQVAIQEGKDHIVDNEYLGTMTLEEATIPNMLRLSYDGYRRDNQEFEFNPKMRNKSGCWSAPDEYESCLEWVHTALNLADGAFNPLNRIVVSPESHFDFEIKRDWAKFSQVGPDGELLEGYLALKGTIDLITEIAPGFYEMIDWKTGRRYDWAKDKEKTFATLKNDPQLRLYHYAAAHKYPDIENWMVTIVFINDGGPYSFSYDKNDLEATERMIRRRYEEIRDNQRPKKNVSYKCTSFCHFGKTQHPQSLSGETICEYIHKDLLTYGITKTTEKHTVPGYKIGTYGSGGGQSERKID